MAQVPMAKEDLETSGIFTPNMTNLSYDGSEVVKDGNLVCCNLNFKFRNALPTNTWLEIGSVTKTPKATVASYLMQTWGGVFVGMVQIANSGENKNKVRVNLTVAGETAPSYGCSFVYYTED